MVNEHANYGTTVDVARRYVAGGRPAAAPAAPAAASPSGGAATPTPSKRKLGWGAAGTAAIVVAIGLKLLVAGKHAAEDRAAAETVAADRAAAAVRAAEMKAEFKRQNAPPPQPVTAEQREHLQKLVDLGLIEVETVEAD